MVYLISGIYLILSFFISILLVTKKQFKKIIPLLSLIILGLVAAFIQKIIPSLIIIPSVAVLVELIMYFTIENPDLKIINELETIKNDIERSNKAKSDFLSNMSHEIRTPMNAIVGFSQTLLNDPNFNEESARNDISHISAAGENLLDIINNILDISKIESGKETLEKKDYSIASVVLELTSIVEARISDKPIKLIVDVSKDIPSKLYGDSTKLFQILLNLLRYIYHFFHR